MYKLIRQKIKINIFIILFATLIILFFFSVTSNASEKKTGIENFPDSYKPYLLELSKKYPNWKFTALYTGLDWKTVIDNEYVFGKNLVPLSYTDEWKCLDPDVYDVLVDAGWVNCSKKSLEYVLDPRNFLNNVRIFQFESLSYNARSH